MILNPSSLTPLQEKWQGVIQMRERMDHLVISTFAFDPITSPAFGNILYNLPFLLALDVLRQVLLQAKEQEQFAGSGQELADLMEAAKISVPWLDWQSLRKAATRQNEVAHQAKLWGDRECLRDISNIEAQLCAWGIITAAKTSKKTQA